MVPPAFAVAGGVTMLYLAVGRPAELVVADYSRIEELTSERFARDAQAAALDVGADAAFAATADGRTAVTLRWVATPLTAPAPILHLHLQHVARKAADRQVVLYRDAAGVYHGELELAAGRYDIELSPADRSWRLSGSLLTVPAELHLRAAPGAGD
jgi:hypothetical protein